MICSEQNNPAAGIDPIRELSSPKLHLTVKNSFKQMKKIVSNGIDYQEILGKFMGIKTSAAYSVIRLKPFEIMQRDSILCGLIWFCGD